LGQGPRSLTARFNGDTSLGPSLSATFSKTVSVVSQQGFQAATNPAVGTNTFAVALGDLNYDGKQDIAAVTASAQFIGVAILTGNGDGTFTNLFPDSSTNPYTTEGIPSSVVVADFNRDGLPDIVMTTSAGIEGYLNTPGFPGEFDGYFQLPAP